MGFRYYLGVLLAIPLLPIMYFQGKKIRSSVPRLPEATGLKGSVHFDPNSEKSIRIIAIGESTIAGVGVETQEEGFTRMLASELSNLLRVNIDWRVYARSGYTAAKVAEKIVPKINEDAIDLIVIGLGGNDAFTLSSPRKWRRDISHLIESLQVKFPKSPIVFCNMPPIKEFPAFTPLIKFIVGNLVEILGRELASLVSGYQNVFYSGEVISTTRWVEKYGLENENTTFFSDGVHPSKLTYQVWAKDVAANVLATEPLIKRLKKSQIAH